MENEVKYQKLKEFLICIDSDGCVMDTMNIKHFTCFGPMVIEEWNLQQNQEEILELWNKQNLFSKTRGINRFQGLALLFKTLAKQGIEIEGRESLFSWCETTTSLSNQALIKEIETSHDMCLSKVLSWSHKVNKKIDALPKVDCVFPNAKEALKCMHKVADIAIVSSANKEAVEEEWTRLGCMKYATILCGQDSGTKAFCINKLKQYYEPAKVLMIGDAVSDLEAAQTNDVSFYPILAGKEKESWQRLKEEFSPRFLSGVCTKEELQLLITEMKENLK